MSGLVYLASPYSHPEPAVRDARYTAACIAAAKLMEAGHAVFSPIAHSVAVAQELPAARELDFAFWMSQDLPVLERCDMLVTLPLPGWQQSRGVAREIALANRKGLASGELLIPDVVYHEAMSLTVATLECVDWLRGVSTLTEELQGVA